MKLFSIIFLIFIGCLGTLSQSFPRLVFNENFNGNQLNTRIWEYGEGCDDRYGGNVMNCWVAGTNNIQVRNGHLVITARIEKHKGKNYTSGVIKQRRGYKYGYFVTRAKLPKGKHFWPAIWLLNMPMNIEGCRSEEIDILEARGQQPDVYEVAAHYGKVWPKIKSTGEKCNFNISDLSQDFHLYGVDWKRDKLTYYFDNKKCYEVALNDGLPSPKWHGENYEEPCNAGTPFSDPTKFIFNLAIGGAFFPDNDLTEEEARNWPKPTYEIDWVRIYQ